MYTEAELIKEAYSSERLLMVGFAETATAIGAAVAKKCRWNGIR